MSSGEYNAHGLTLTWEVSDNFTIKSLTGYRELDDDIYQNYAAAFSTPGVPFPTEFVTFDTLDTEQFTQELQFLGSIGERFDYLVGLYYFKEEGDHFQHIDIDIPGFGLFPSVDKDRDIDAESESKAVFAQVTWTPRDPGRPTGADTWRPLHGGQPQGHAHDAQHRSFGLPDSASSQAPFSLPVATASTRTSASSIRRSRRTWRGRRM